MRVVIGNNRTTALNTEERLVRRLLLLGLALLLRLGEWVVRAVLLGYDLQACALGVSAEQVRMNDKKRRGASLRTLANPCCRTYPVRRRDLREGKPTARSLCPSS